MDPTSSGRDAEKTCVLCCQDVDIFALGKCDHPVCYRCSTKMRVLCDQKYCAVCREELDKVVFVKKLEAFQALPLSKFPSDKKQDIYFGDEMIHSQYRHLLLSVCILCPEQKVFSRFEELEQHMRKQHELFCCKLCTKHLKIFSHERKWYNRKELARHRAHGDPDDTSHRGHPLCKFCDDRYLDNDELLKHLRRDHYFCHFCDADGSQEYYSDYPYLSDHFRESHYLCEEGRCATEQFTHAFRSEIDYKAHKAAAHSKSRAEARQNRHIDLQFTYAPRPQRRNEGMVSGEDYEEVRHNRGGRGRPQGGQKSWRYSREEEDRQVEAALRASRLSMATRRQEDRGAPRREERAEPEEPRHPGPARPPVKTMKSSSPGEEDDFPALGATAAAAMVKPPPAAAPSPRPALKEDDFPSLSTAAPPSPMTPAYSAPPRTRSSFQEEDFPALVSKARPPRPAGGGSSAWSSHPAKPSAQPPPSRVPPPLSSSSSGPQLLSSSSSSSSRRKKKAELPASRRSPPPSDGEDGGGLTQQEFRSVPTMLDISSLLTVKGGSSKAPAGTSHTPNPPQPPQPAPPTEPASSRANRKKKQKNAVPPPAVSAASTGSTPAVERAQKENVPEKTWTPPAPPSPVPLANGYTDKPLPVRDPAAPPPDQDPGPDPEEEFPALKTKKPPPGFKSSFPMKASAPPSSTLPPPPPGLAVSAPKPPPGFTGIPLNSNVDPPPSGGNQPPKASSSYLVPDDFQQRNLDLIQSIKKNLHDDESKFNQFKTFSVQFRQGVISAAQYHLSCKELLGDGFSRIFAELLVLLPDTGKQQELLLAHGDGRAAERPGGGGRKNRSKRSAWQAPPSAGGAAADLDCQVCPTCRQVLAPKDVHAHRSMHSRDTEDFPSLQAISRIIS